MAGAIPFNVNSGTLTVSSTLIDWTSQGGAGGIVKNGAGTLTLSGSSTNTYSGTTTVNGGTLVLNKPTGGPTNDYGSAVGNLDISNGSTVRLAQSWQIRDASTLNVNSGSTFDLNGWSERIRNLNLNSSAVTGAGASELLAGSGVGDAVSSTGTSTISATTFRLGDQIPITVTTGALTIQSQITDFTGAGGITKNGIGTLILAGSNTYSGNTSVAGGTLLLQNSSALQNSTLDYNSNGGVLNFGSLTSANVGGLKGNQNLPLSNGSNAVALTVGGNNSTTTYSGVLGSTGSLTKIGSGVLTLTNANTFTGETKAKAGTILLQNPSALQNSTLDYSSYGGSVGFGNITAATFGGLKGNQDLALTNGTAALALTVGGNNSTTAYSGVLSGGGSLTKAGTGTLTLSAVNSYSGGTTINGGTLSVAGDTSLGSLTGGLTFNGGTLKTLSGISTLRPITVAAAGGTIDTSGFNSTYGGTISGTGALVKTGAGILTLSGTNSYSGDMTISAGRLNVAGSIQGSVTVSPGATLGGGEFGIGGNIHGTVYSQGTVAPGASPGILHIAGDYVQYADSKLEIEVGGSETRGAVAGTDFDKVQVDGHAYLDGVYTFPIVNNYQPQLNDEITFLTANAISGALLDKNVFAPNLKSINPSLGFVVVKNGQDLKLRFVTPTDVHFVDNTSSAPQDWQQMAKWADGTGAAINRVPGSSDKVDLSRSQLPNAQQVNVASTDAGSYEVFVHDQSSPITLAVMNDKKLSASTGDITVGKLATIALGDGTTGNTGTLVATDHAVTVQDGGTLKGNGIVSAGSLDVMNGTVSPGFAVGQLDVHGGYSQHSAGTLQIDITGIGGVQHDALDVTGTAQVDGVVSINAAGFVPGTVATGTYGSPIPVLDAANRTGTFSRVVTTGNSNVVFLPVYSAPGAGSGSAAGAGSELAHGTEANGCDVSVCFAGYYLGDMNHDSFVNRADIPYFAMALSDNDKYVNQLIPNGAVIGPNARLVGDFTGGPNDTPDGKLTFDDISAFASRLGLPTGAMLAAMQGQPIPEPSTGALSLVCTIFLAFQRVRQSATRSSRV